MWTTSTLRNEVQKNHGDWEVHVARFSATYVVDILVHERIFCLEMTTDDSIGVSEIDRYDVAAGFSGHDLVVSSVDEAIAYVEGKLTTTTEDPRKIIFERLQQQSGGMGVGELADHVSLSHPDWKVTAAGTGLNYLVFIRVREQLFVVVIDPDKGFGVSELQPNEHVPDFPSLQIVVSTLDKALAFVEQRLSSELGGPIR